jgi:hypothetical protein
LFQGLNKQFEDEIDNRVFNHPPGSCAPFLSVPQALRLRGKGPDEKNCASRLEGFKNISSFFLLRTLTY